MPCSRFSRSRSLRSTQSDSQVRNPRLPALSLIPRPEALLFLRVLGETGSGLWFPRSQNRDLGHPAFGESPRVPFSHRDSMSHWGSMTAVRIREGKVMKASGRFFSGLAILCIAASAGSQHVRRQVLTEAQIEKVREAAVDPDERIKLYTQFINDHADTLKSLSGRAKSGARTKRLDDELQDLTALMDELASNLDQYGDRKADMRISLKKLNEDVPKWIDMLKSFPTEPSYDEARKEALGSGKDLAEDAKKLLDEQTVYFANNKKAKGQERQEPE